MDDLFKALFQAIEQLLEVGKKARNGPLSQLGESYQRGDPTCLFNWEARWKTCLKRIGKEYHQLARTVKRATHYERNADISRCLAYFRQMPKMLAEDDTEPQWSIHYFEIREYLSHINNLLIDIDTKYKLGKHRWDNMESRMGILFKGN